jgi:hypothetical protein
MYDVWNEIADVLGSEQHFREPRRQQSDIGVDSIYGNVNLKLSLLSL